MENLINEIKKYQKILPNEYLKEIDEEDIINIYIHLNKLKKNRSNSASFKGNNVRFFLHRYDKSKLLKRLKRLLPFPTPSLELIKIIVNKENNFILTAFYHEINRNIKLKSLKPPFENEKKYFLKNENEIKEDIKFEISDRVFILKIINISANTLFRNLLETLEKNENEPLYIKIWTENTGESKIKTFHKIIITFKKELTNKEINSLKEDFIRYLQHYIKVRSVFDMIGPAMIGPSSSHTAGANRIGNIARNFFISLKDYISNAETTPYVKVFLYSSFADTGLGHKTPNAIGAGLLGYQTDTPNMTKYGLPDYMIKNFKLFEDIKIDFKGYFTEDKNPYSELNQSNIAKIILYLDDEKISITGFSIGGGNIEIRYINDIKLPEPITGKEDKEYTLHLKKGKIVSKIKKIYKTTSSSRNISLPFNTMEELLDYQKNINKNIIEIILDTEYSLQYSTSEEIYKTLEKYWNIMKSSISIPLKNPQKSSLGLTGKDANKIFNYKSSLFKDNIYKKAVYYATAVNEYNAQSGLIIACPTAGSSGIVPGVLKAYQEITDCKNKEIYDALLVSGFLGMILFDDVTTAGADFGCQAEVGAAAAMAAAAITFLEKGDLEAIIHAFTLALKNSLGLVCDPVGGLVEVPCVKRNGIYSSMALSSALMALSGVRSFVSPDEVILAMQEIGNKLNSDYKETARGGLAKTRDAKEINIKMQKLKEDFFK